MNPGSRSLKKDMSICWKKNKSVFIGKLKFYASVPIDGKPPFTALARQGHLLVSRVKDTWDDTSSTNSGSGNLSRMENPQADRRFSAQPCDMFLDYGQFNLDGR